jgi:hypothetical protein
MASKSGFSLLVLNDMPSNTRSEIYFRDLLGRTDIQGALNMLDSLIQKQIRMAATHIMKVNSEVNEGAHPCQPGAHVPLKLCPSSCQESQLRVGYSEQHERDNLFVICYLHCLCQD